MDLTKLFFKKIYFFSTKILFPMKIELHGMQAKIMTGF